MTEPTWENIEPIPLSTNPSKPDVWGGTNNENTAELAARTLALRDALAAAGVDFTVNGTDLVITRENGATVTVPLPPGPEGPAGAPGGSDEAFAGWIDDAASQTRAALTAQIGQVGDSRYSRADLAVDPVAAPFNADPTGTDDATSALNSAILTAATLGAGVVLQPDATFKVTPTAQGRALTARAGVTVYSEGATLRVADDAPAFSTVIGHDFADDVSGFTLRGVTIDCNNAPRPVTDVVTGENHAAVTITRGNNIAIDHCTFTNIDSINTIICNGAGGTGPSVVRAVNITDNTFLNVGTSTYHDHSTIYTHAEHVTVSRNRFLARTISDGPAVSAVCAIEVHGSDHNVSFNQIDGYREAINLAGASFRCDRVVCIGNTASNVMRGIRLFATKLYGGVTPSLRSVVVADNAISCEPNYWADALTGISPALLPTSIAPYGLAALLGGGSSGDTEMHGVKITGNSFLCTPYTGSHTSVAAGLSASGIHISRSGTFTAPQADSDLTIQGNTIVGFPSCGIAIAGLRHRRTLISDNDVSMYGHSAIADSAEYRAGVYAAGEHTMLTITDNMFHDTAGQAQRGVSYLGASTSTGVVIARNHTSLSAAGHRAIFVGSDSGNPRIDQIALGGNLARPTANTAVGSTFADPATGTVWMQTTAPAGATWRAETSGTAAPTTGTWAVGDRVWNTTPVDGGHMGWVCTTAGTPGTWKTFGAVTA